MKTLVQHEIFARNVTWCRECGSEVAKRSRDIRIKHGHVVPPKMRRSVVVSQEDKNLVVRSANGYTVMYQLDETTNKVRRTVSICWRDDQFSKKVGVGNCTIKMETDFAKNELPLFNEKFTIRTCNELFREHLPIFVDGEVM